MPTPDEDSTAGPVAPEENDSGEKLPPAHKFARKKLLRKFAILLLVITVTGKSVDKVLEVVQMKNGERQEKIQALNVTMTDGLNHMRPSFVAGQFFGRLVQPHGLVFGQWEAPFNAQVALDTLDRQQRLRTKPVTDELNSLESQKLSLSLRSMPLDGNSEDWWRQNSALDKQTKDVQATHDLLEGVSQSARTGVEKWEIGTLIPSRGFGIPIAFVLNTLLALPDAYLDLTKNLLPHLPWVFRVIVVLLVFLIALIIAGRRESIKPALWFLFLLPVAVSLLASLCAGIVWGFAALFHPVAPILSVTGSAVLSPFLLWTSSKVAEHHIVEAILHRLPKTLTGE